MVILHIPELRELWFRKELLEDESTMSFNHSWGGTILFPESDWNSWYDHWVIHNDGKRFYRYLREQESGRFVGEIAYHLDRDRQLWLADVIIKADSRGKGYGTQGLRLLCESAAHNGIDILRDNIAIDNSAIRLFLREGFVEEYRTEEIIMLKKVLDRK